MTEQEIQELLRWDAQERAEANKHRWKTPECFSLLQYELGVYYGWTAEQWNHLRTGCRFCTHTIAMTERVIAQESAPAPTPPGDVRYRADPNLETVEKPPEKPTPPSTLWDAVRAWIGFSNWVPVTAACGVLLVALLAYQMKTTISGGSRAGGDAPDCPVGAVCVPFYGSTRVLLPSVLARRSVRLCLTGAPAEYFEGRFTATWRLSWAGSEPVQSEPLQGRDPACASVEIPPARDQQTGRLELLRDGIQQNAYEAIATIGEGGK